MNELLELNKRYLIKGYLWISRILTIGFSTYLFFFYSEVTTRWILVIYILTLFIVPFFILSVRISDWFRKRRYKKRILNQKPYSELEKTGFKKKIIKTNHNGLIDYVQFTEVN